MAILNVIDDKLNLSEIKKDTTADETEDSWSGCFGSVTKCSWKGRKVALKKIEIQDPRNCR